MASSLAVVLLFYGFYCSLVARLFLWSCETQGMLGKHPTTEPLPSPPLGIMVSTALISASYTLFPFFVFIAVVLASLLHNWEKLIFLVMIIYQSKHYMTISAKSFQCPCNFIKCLSKLFSPKLQFLWAKLIKFVTTTSSVIVIYDLNC